VEHAHQGALSLKTTTLRKCGYLSSVHEHTERGIPRGTDRADALRHITNEETISIDANPERGAEEQAEENASGGTTPVNNIGMETRRRDARHGFDATDPAKGLRPVSDSIHRRRAGCHTTGRATHTPRESMFTGPCLRTATRSRYGAHRVMTRIFPELRVSSH
jgi:hypothetical protein